MIRIKDPAKSLPFYTDVLGMSVIKSKEIPAAGFNLYFLSYDERFPGPEPDEVPEGVAENLFREGVVELTWIYGTEKEEGKVYYNGNEEPVVGWVGFGLGVPDVNEAEAYLRGRGVEILDGEKMQGEMGGVAVLDPDGYRWILTQA
jgi:lactoylglutathione lyase